MDLDSDNLNMQNLKDYVFDESKIVTYKWLANNLSIHINEAKKLLDRFIKDQESNSKFVKTFYISGILKDNKGMVSTIVKEEDLKSFRDSLQTVFSEHIYSIHKGTVSTDSSALFLAGEHEDVCIGTITSSSISKRTFDELTSLRLGAYPKAFLPKNVKAEEPTKTNKTAPTPNKMFFKDPVVKKEPESLGVLNSDKNNQPVTNKPKPNKSGIAGFFAKQINNPVPKVEKKIESAQQNKVEQLTTSADKVINGIKNETSPLKPANLPNIKNENSPVVKEEKTTTKSSDKGKPVEKEIKSKNTSLKTYSKKIDPKKSSTKKRKRIQTLESDSEEENNVDDIFAPSSPEPVKSPFISDDEDIIPPTPEIIKSSNHKAPLNSRKRKKIIDKTFIDDNGYFITKKEEVLESCSENEDEIDVAPAKSAPPSEKKITETKIENPRKKHSPEVKETKSKSKKKTSPQNQGKQQSLMNFFKKAAT